MLAFVLTVAVIGGDHVALRAAPERNAAQQAVLWKGDWLEVRGERKGWLSVYDHRHERPGWVARPNVRVVTLDEAAAPSLRAVVDFVRDTPGSESLGIAYAGLYIKVAPKDAIDAAMLVSLGTMADRLAKKASTSAEGAAAEQLAVAESWGVKLTSVERADGARVCYDGEAFREALALPTHFTPADAATRGPRPHRRWLRAFRAGASRAPGPRRRAPGPPRQGRSDPGRRAGRGCPAHPARPDRCPAGVDPRPPRRRRRRHAGRGRRDVGPFARVDKTELGDDDVLDYDVAALTVAASRWAAIPAPPTVAGAPVLALEPGEAGETCLTLTPAKGAASPRRCTHGQVWASSFRVAPDRSAAVLAVQPLPGWLELWLFRRGADGGWMVDILAPSTDGPELGYVDVVGFAPDHQRAIIVREAKRENTVDKSYQIVNLGNLAVEKQATTLAGLGSARQWASREWHERTLASR